MKKFSDIKLLKNDHKLLVPTLIVFTVFAVYLNTMENSFHYDDYHSIVGNPYIRHLSNIPGFFKDASMFSSSPDMVMYRPVLLTSYVISYMLGGYEMWGWHLLNIIIHALNALLFYYFSRRHMGRTVAFTMAVVFAVHPFCAEPVNYISSRSSLLAATFFISSMLAYTCYFSSERKPFFALSLLLFFAGMLTKEPVIVLPGVLIFHDLLLSKADAEDATTRLVAFFKRILPFAVLAGVYILIRRAFLLPTLPSSHIDRTVWENLLVQSEVMSMYFKHFFIPVGYSGAYEFNVAGFSYGKMIGIVLISGLAVSAFIASRNMPLFSIGVLWFFLSILPETLWPLNLIAADRRMYLPFMGILISIGALVDTILDAEDNLPTVAPGICAVFIVFSLAFLTVDRNRDWSSGLTFWADAVSKCPESAVAYDSYGHYLASNAEHERALRAFRIAVYKNPNSSRANANLGITLAELGKYQDAVWYIKQSIEISRKLGTPNRARIKLGNIYYRMGHLKKAEAQLGIAVKENPFVPIAHYDMARVFAAQLKTEQAEKHFRIAAELDPGFSGPVNEELKKLRAIKK